MERLTLLRVVAPQWPDLPAPEQCVPDRPPVPPEEWPPLALTWWDIRPTVLSADKYTGYRTESLLQADGAPAPIALVSWAPMSGARYGHGWLWRCQVHVVGAHCDSAGCCSYDCTKTGRSTTRDGARVAAEAHIRDTHADAAVPYRSRRFHAVRSWI
ncbi:hypothetical protein [Streptomyces sp. NPDC055692]|uniref:hypothetical protein n=1 Tax=Streptomyces sp. NPDC055692 TaxID=3155683 RepID=UPI00342089EA